MAEVTVGSGNVFADLGLPNPEERLVKAQLARQIYICITDRKLTQTEAATILGIDQPKVSNLINGKLAAFSIDRLFRFLNALDCNVEIMVKPKPSEQIMAKIVVLTWTLKLLVKHLTQLTEDFDVDVVILIAKTNKTYAISTGAIGL